MPQAWAVAAPSITLAAASLPGTGAGATSEVEGSGSANLFSDMMLAGMATRAMGGTVPRPHPTVIPRSPAAG